MMLGSRLLSPLALLTAAVPTTGSAQIKASEAASVSQTIDGTKITLEYYRPRARERDTLFGKVVTWGEVWTPGANWATTLEVSKDVRLNGHPIPKGKYSVWMVVRKEADWTAVFDPKFKRYHEEHPDSSAEQIRFAVHPEQRSFLEVLTWSFPEIKAIGGMLAMQWGTVYLPLEIRVTPSYPTLSLAEAKAAPYLGSFEWVWKQGPPGDPKPLGFVVSHENGSLMGRWDPAPYPEWAKFILIRIADDWFIPGFLVKGELYEVAKEMVIEFKVQDGKAVGFDVRGEDDTIMATGKRKN